jgi:hypothetical protein
MKYLVGIFAGFLMTSGISASALAACGYGDTTISQSMDYAYTPCTTSGYCNAYDVNPATGQYEYFYGYHSSCPGHSQQTTMNFMCRRSNGSSYSTSDVVGVGPCSAN